MNDKDGSVSIVFSDYFSHWAGDVDEMQIKSNMNKGMDRIYEFLLKYIGNNIKEIEFLPESIIWQDEFFRNTFYEKIVKMNITCDNFFREQQRKNEDLKSKHMSSSIRYFFNNMVKVIYAHYLKTDTIFHAGKDAKTVWRHILRGSHMVSVFGNNYTPPHILQIDDIPCPNRKGNLLSAYETNDPFSKWISSEKVRESLSNSTEEYKHYLSKLFFDKGASGNFNIEDLYKEIKDFRQIVF